MSRKIVLVTGASSGLGKAISEALSREGHKVYGVCRSAEAYPDITGFELLSMDVTRTEDIDRVINYILEDSGRLDVVVNNAGKGITGPIETTPLEEIERVFDLNLYGPLRVVQKALPHMRRTARDGKIVNIGSIAGYMGLPFRGIYSASKAALGIVTESLRLECADSGIVFCTVDPGDFATDIGSRRYHTTNDADSPYFRAYGRVLEQIHSEVDSGLPPSFLSDKVLKILRKSNPKPHYAVGAPLEKLSIVLKAILPAKVYERMLKKHYKL